MVDTVSKPSDTLFDTSLINLNSVFFVDGSTMRNPTHGSPCVSYGIYSNHDIVKSTNIPNNLSAQAAVVFFILETGNHVTVHTDSQYAFNVCHDFTH